MYFTREGLHTISCNNNNVKYEVKMKINKQIWWTILASIPDALLRPVAVLSINRFFYIFLFLLFYNDFCRFCVVIRFFHPRHNGQWPPTSKDFLSQNLSITFIFLSLVWRGPWMAIKPGTSGTRSQHYTTRLSRRR